MPVTVSVVIPARNAALTLGETLKGLLAQSFTDWEAIVIDDGSTDRTAALGTTFAARDQRIKVVTRPSGGVSAARNAGISLARHGWLLFLDADDLIVSDHLERLTARLDDDSSLDIVHCGWAQLTPNGDVVGHKIGPDRRDLFAEFARYCVFPIHACLVRRVCVQAVGGFDTALRTCEDFDLWQRIARTGARFGSVPDVLAIYRMRPDSASVEGRQVLVDGLVVIGRGHALDHRVTAPSPAHVDGMPQAQLGMAQLLFACWCAGLVIGKGGDACSLLGLLEEDTKADLPAGQVASHIFQTVPTARCLPPSAWPDIWPAVADRVDQFFRALEARCEAGLAREAGTALEDLILGSAPTFPPLVIGRTYGFQVDVSSEIPDVPAPAEVERVRCTVCHGNERLGPLHLPVFDGLLSKYVLQDAIAAEYTWPILREFIQQTLGHTLQKRTGDGEASVWRGPVCLATHIDDNPELNTYSEEVHNQAGWTVFLQELWGHAQWTMDLFYNPDAKGELGDVVRVDGDWLIVEVSGALPDIIGRGPDLNVVVQVGGLPLGVLSVPLNGERLSGSSLRVLITRKCGFELCRAAVRAAVVGSPFGAEPLSLRARLARAAAAGASEVSEWVLQLQDAVRAPGWRGLAHRALGSRGTGTLMARHSVGTIDSPSSRRATLPAHMLAELWSAARVNGEPVIHVPGPRDPPDQLLYVPELNWRPRTATLAEANEAASPNPANAAREYGRGRFERFFASQTDPWKYTSPYEQVKYEQTLALLPHGPINRALEVGCAEGHFTRQLAARVESLVAADISRIALLRAAERCTGRHNVQFLQLDLVADPIPGRFNVLICSELLYYTGDLDGLKVVARKLVEALEPGGYLLHAHANLVVDEPNRTGFDWVHPFGAKVIGDTLADTSPLHLIRELRTPLYRIQLFRHGRSSDLLELIELPEQPTPLSPEVERHVLWHGGTPPRTDDNDEPRTASLPILMYHRVASTGSTSLDRYRVTPQAFEEQLAYLRDAAYYSVTLSTWRNAMAEHNPLPGRAVLLTFDDGYRDFATDAWPLLKRYGFSAMVFLVADEIGGVNCWDRAYQDTVPLLGWNDIHRLQREGLDFGSHTASHKRLAALTPAEIVQEFARSRTILTQGLGRSVDALAYPYGATDAVAQHLAGACGFTFGLTCRPGRSGLWEAPLSLPRIEVRGDGTFADFVTALGD